MRGGARADGQVGPAVFAPAAFCKARMRPARPSSAVASAASIGAALKVLFATLEDEAALFSALDRNGFSQIALSPAGHDDIADIGRDGRTALWLGSEGHGLTAATMARMRTARIAMSASFDSLNVATAGAIALHRLWRER